MTDNICSIPSAVNSCGDSYFVGLARSEIFGRSVDSACNILRLYSPLTCQIYSYSVPVGVFDFVPGEPYLVIFLAVFYLDVGGIGECCLVIFFFDRQTPVGIFAIVFDDCIFTVSADNSCGGICVYPAFAIGEFCISFYIFEIRR